METPSSIVYTESEEMHDGETNTLIQQNGNPLRDYTSWVDAMPSVELKDHKLKVTPKIC